MGNRIGQFLEENNSTQICTAPQQIVEQMIYNSSNYLFR